MWRRYVRRGLLTLSGVLAAFLVYLLATRVDSGPSSSVPIPTRLERADAGINQFTFTQSRSGSLQWQVQAKHARVFETESRAVLEQVQVTLYGPKGRELRLEGDEGVIDTSTKNFTLTKRVGPIVVQMENGYTIYTNHLVWTDKQREISTSDPVTIAGNGLEINGRGLVGQLDVEEFKVLEDVRVDIVQ